MREKEKVEKREKLEEDGMLLCSKSAMGGREQKLERERRKLAMPILITFALLSVEWRSRKKFVRENKYNVLVFNWFHFG